MTSYGFPDLVNLPQVIRNPLVAKERLNPAEWTYERLVKQIVKFEAKLSADEELGGRFVTAPKDGAIHIADIGYWNPDMLIFYGTDSDGRSIELLQHHSQLSLLLCAIPKEKEKPRRIGFILEERLKGG